MEEKRTRAWKRRIRTAATSYAEKADHKTMRRLMKKGRQPLITAVAIKKEETEQEIEENIEEEPIPIGKERIVTTRQGIMREIEKAWRNIFNKGKTMSYQEFQKK